MRLSKTRRAIVLLELGWWLADDYVRGLPLGLIFDLRGVKQKLVPVQDRLRGLEHRQCDVELGFAWECPDRHRTGHGRELQVGVVRFARKGIANAKDMCSFEAC